MKPIERWVTVRRYIVGRKGSVQAMIKVKNVVVATDVTMNGLLGKSEDDLKAFLKKNALPYRTVFWRPRNNDNIL
jgi:hypothetical protein